MKNKIVIIVEGGVIQEVRSTGDVKAVVVDMDDLKDETSEAERRSIMEKAIEGTKEVAFSKAST